MLQNYFTIALRQLLKNQSISLIKIIGLALGIACAIVIAAYVVLELKYDRYHQRAEDIYRITVHYQDEGRFTHSAMNFSPFAEVVRDKSKSAEAVVRIFPVTGYLSGDKINKYKEDRICFSDSLFFKVFSFKSLSASLDHALDAPFSVVLSERAALKYFGTIDNIIGKEIQYEDDRKAYALNVTGVIQNVPQESHFDFDIIASFNTLDTTMPWYNNWHHPPMYVYMLSQPGAKASDINSELQSIAGNYQPSYVTEEKRTYNAQNIVDIHLKSNLENEWQSNSDISYIYLFVALAGFILVLACINFTNLVTAQASNRSKEVGLKKSMGALKENLVIQFLGETLMLTILSGIIGLVLAELSFTFFFNSLLGKELSLQFLLEGFNGLYLIGFILLIALISGIYPSFYLSRFQPITVLKGMLTPTDTNVTVRKSLVVFQFSVSSLLIVGTLVAIHQFNFLRNKKLGFESEKVVSLHMPDKYSSRNYQKLKDALLQESMVESVALSSTIPSHKDFYTFDCRPEGVPADKTISFHTLGVDEDFINTYNLTLLNGRNFTIDVATDATEGIILNEAAVKKLNWVEPIGKEFHLTVYTPKEELRKGQVIGIVKDFHFTSLYNQIEPLVIYINKHSNYADYLSIKLKPGNVSNSIELIEKRWKEFNPEKPMELFFIDAEMEQLYQNDRKQSSLFSTFTLLSMAISCLGLFGLSTYLTQQKAKEIGIRKVLGASVPSILRLLSKEYITMIIIATVLSWPMAWYLANQWLSHFAYRIDIGAEIFALSTLGAILIVALSVGYQSIRAAKGDPVKSLRYE